MSQWKIHPVCKLFPSMNATERRELVEDIKANGLLEPIVTHGSWIIDGKNRLAACEEAGVNPRFVEWDGKGSLVAFSLSKNLKRRNLTSSERAVIAAESLPIFQQEAKARQEKGKGDDGSGGRGKAKTLASHDAKVSSKAASDAAKVAGVSSAQVERAAELKRKDPPKYKQVKAGEKTVGQAHRELKAEEAAKAEEAPPVDGLGRPIKVEKVYEAFRSEELGDLIRDLSRVKRSAMALCGTPLGAFVHPQSLETDLNNALRHLRAARPYAVCTYCRNGTGCKTCRKQGWITKDIYDATPEDMRR